MQGGTHERARRMADNSGVSMGIMHVRGYYMPICVCSASMGGRSVSNAQQ
jgi:hypothetical protein